jgi:polyketide cyclase/dehydrase/lipid transport protein
MGTFQLKICINRPAADVFAVVADPRNMPRWYDAVERVVELAPGTSPDTARFRVTRSLAGSSADNIVDVTAASSNRTVLLESRSGPTPFRYRYTIEPQGTGSLLTLDAQISGSGLPVPLRSVDAVTTRAFKHGMRQNLDVLKHLVESNAAREPR